MPEPVDLSLRMREEWNQRAREDAHYYVAFGRREQANEEFLATAKDVVLALEPELRRFPANANQRRWRALEIGCGPGRLMRPMSRQFGEIHGVDVSDEMIARARQNLRDIPHAHVRATTGADLAPFADESFDFVYSYAVFQHIPSREVVLRYLNEARRVLKPGGILRCQINGLDKTAKTYDTWSGVRMSAEEVREFAASAEMQLLVLEGVRTQYMWTTMRKRTSGWREHSAPAAARIRRVTNAHTSEPVTPASGRFASFAVSLENLPADIDLVGLTVRVDGIPAEASYISPPERDGLQQINAYLREAPRTGVLPLELLWHGRYVCEPGMLRVISSGPFIPQVLSVTDGINVMAGPSIDSGTVKVTVEETDQPESFEAEVSGKGVDVFEIFCVDPSLPRYEINFELPAGLVPGAHELRMRLGRRSLGSVMLQL